MATVKGDPYAHVSRQLRAMVGELLSGMALVPGSRVLDYGCGDQPYRALVPAESEYVGADRPGNRLAAVDLSEGWTVPEPDASFQAVMSTQVLQHVEQPSTYLHECYRVLAPGGKLLLTTYGLMSSNADSRDRWRWTGEGLRRLVDDAGFHIVEFRGLLGLAATGLQLFQLATAPRLPRWAGDLYTGSMQRIISWLDGRAPTWSRTDNALVLGVLAEKPVPGRIDQVVAAFAEACPAASFVQIGANDGEQRDPLRREILRRSWTGVLVEPLPFVFARLQRNYAGVDRVRLVNLAVADRDGERPLFHLAQSDDPSLPRWYDALGSFRRDVVLRHRTFIPDIEDRLVSTDVACVTPSTLLDRYGAGPVDLVQVDTEGYDYEILRRFPFELTEPTLVIYEHHHLSDGDRTACQELLRGEGFDLFEESLDTVALHMERAAASPALMETWHRVAVA